MKRGTSSKLQASCSKLAPSVAVAVAVAVSGCSKPATPANDTTATVARQPEGIEPGDPRCPATGLWAQCSVLYRLERAAVAPHLDSTATVDEHQLTGRSFVVKIGRSAALDVFIYPDSAARMTDEQMITRTDYLLPGQPQTMRHQLTLIENANLLAFLHSLNDHQRERVSDALTAGAPPPFKSK